MAKKNTSFRLEEDQIAELEQLVDYYKTEMVEATSKHFHVSVSKASVIELLIRERFNELKNKGLI